MTGLQRRGKGIFIRVLALAAFTLVGPLRAHAQSQAGLPPEVLVARAAAAYGSIAYGQQEEEQALRDLGQALRQVPQDRQAQQLLAAILKRREERRKQQERKGQQYLDQQQADRQAQQQGQGEEKQADERKPKTARQEDQLAHRQPDTQHPSGGDRPGQMSRAEAERLLDALEQQERRPTQRLPAQGRGPQGPRW